MTDMKTQIIQHLVHAPRYLENEYGCVIGPFPVALGESISIQASAAHYCSPRKNLKDRSQYTNVEVLAPVGSRLHEKLSESYADDTTGVFGWVDIDVLASILEEVYGGVEAW